MTFQRADIDVDYTGSDFQKADIAIFYWRVDIVFHCILEVTDWQVKVRQALAAWGDEGWGEGSDLRYQGTEGCYETWAPFLVHRVWLFNRRVKQCRGSWWGSCSNFRS